VRVLAREQRRAPPRSAVPAAPACRVGRRPDAVNEHGELLWRRHRQRQPQEHHLLGDADVESAVRVKAAAGDAEQRTVSVNC
jgi:hypothetical protein